MPDETSETTAAPSLQALGISPAAEAVYRALLSRSQATTDDLVEELQRTPAEVTGLLSDLEGLGLVNRMPGRPLRMRAARPDVALEVLVSRRQQELARVQLASRQLLTLIPPAERHRPEDIVEVVVGPSAIAARFEQLLDRTRDELLVLDRPPYVTDSARAESTVKSLLRDEVTVRGIYAPEAIEEPGALQAVQDAIRSGEQSRVHPAIGMKLAISDRELAIMPVGADEAVEAALCIRPSVLLDALAQLFDLLWQLATPIVVPDSDHEPTDSDRSDRELAALLGSGAKDDVIARHLGTSPRTLSRRISQLMDNLHVRTRFQAGARAAGLGWLSPDPEGPDRGLVQ
ncbi:helix-turn-helix domain-containing protein [Microlunatus soli]|uniref:Sugar-specific transcriptional regulator TrmB n=1 Tax=Microlunatus soli TaxID=630515 RepID=A0A1H1YGS7_9ACTN|nr:helix-turn-helix domain-containing protein [Microlunatus soli]SDT20670.1 Sugar-specific transcriptional regulator TrmB [Microlunatus soli]